MVHEWWGMRWLVERPSHRMQREARSIFEACHCMMPRRRVHSFLPTCPSIQASLGKHHALFSAGVCTGMHTHAQAMQSHNCSAGGRRDQQRPWQGRDGAILHLPHPSMARGLAACFGILRAAAGAATSWCRILAHNPCSKNVTQVRPQDHGLPSSRFHHSPAQLSVRLCAGDQPLPWRRRLLPPGRDRRRQQRSSRRSCRGAPKAGRAPRRPVQAAERWDEPRRAAGPSCQLLTECCPAPDPLQQRPGSRQGPPASSARGPGDAAGAVVLDDRAALHAQREGASKACGRADQQRGDLSELEGSSSWINLQISEWLNMQCCREPSASPIC
jgi:hypothetical protein